MLRHLQTPKLHSPSSNLRLSKKALDFRIQISSDSKSLGIPLRGQKTGHVVIRQVHAVWPLIHQYRDRGVRSGIRNVLCHFLHDERIANHKVHDFRIVPSGLLTQNRAMIQFHKHHKASPAQTSLNHAFQFSEVPCALGCLRYGEEHTFHVDVEDRVKELLGDRSKRGKLRNSGIREHNIDLALLPLDLCEKAIKIVELRHVALYAADIFPDFPYRRSQLWLPRPVMKMYAPSFTSRLAVARPIPPLPPVMSAIFLSRSPSDVPLGNDAAQPRS